MQDLGNTLWTIASWELDDRAVILAHERGAEMLYVVFEAEGSERFPHKPDREAERELVQRGFTVSGDFDLMGNKPDWLLFWAEGDERFRLCSEALAHARELGVPIGIRPNFDLICERRGPPRLIDTLTGCPHWNRPNDCGPYWYVYLDETGRERAWESTDRSIIATELIGRMDRRAWRAFRDGLTPVVGIGGRVLYVRQPDPGLQPWFEHLRIPDWYRDQKCVLYEDWWDMDEENARFEELLDELEFGHKDDDPILAVPI